MCERELDILRDTLLCCEQGACKGVPLSLSLEEMAQAQVFLPQEVHALPPDTSRPIVAYSSCRVSCTDQDAFASAADMNILHNLPPKYVEVPRTLVLNLANPVHPGGGVRKGSHAQEEDLCRSSSLLLSLESQAARRYYEYNKSLNTYLGSDAIILSPHVEVFKDRDGNPLEKPFTVAVMTCAAPMLRYGTEGKTPQEYEQLLRTRIRGMLNFAASTGYDHLVLGAFGCGAFRNDAKLVSDLFYSELRNFTPGGWNIHYYFKRITFAVLSTRGNSYNYQEFFRNFGNENFFREDIRADQEAFQKKIQDSQRFLDPILGCLAGGAAGDALGYPVEFHSYEQILRQYGPNGITRYELDPSTGKALISDDTQMSLFTADGVLVQNTKAVARSHAPRPHTCIFQAYLDWLDTQEHSFEEDLRLRENSRPHRSWLSNVEGLYHRRAPGLTCLSALQQLRDKVILEVSLEKPINNSKGCGGIMRVAPLGLFRYPYASREELMLEGAKVAAITHGHPLGYLPAGILTDILHSIVYGPKAPLADIIQDSMAFSQKVFREKTELNFLLELLRKAMMLAWSPGSDIEHIRALGEGWVAEETLAIAVYCALRYEDDFSGGLIAAVNHSGDSDSTGAITGNILGAVHGYAQIDDRWKENLELLDIITEIGGDLCRGCIRREYGQALDPEWIRKYALTRGI